MKPPGGAAACASRAQPAAAGEGPCAIFMVGTRGSRELTYPVDGLALRHRAGVRTEAHDARDAYGPREFKPARFLPGSLP